MDSNTLPAVKQITPKHCDHCGSKYMEGDQKIVKNQNGQMVLHLKCHNCSNSYLLNIFSPMPGIIGSTRSNLNLDISNGQELVKFVNLKPIEINEALDAYNTIARSDALHNYLPGKGKTVMLPHKDS